MTLKGKFIVDDVFIANDGTKYNLTLYKYQLIPLNQECYINIIDKGGWYLLEDFVLA